MMKNKIRNQNGFTLIEILVVIGLIAILATIVLIAINPARQFRQAHDTQRTSNVNAILNAIGQRYADNKGVLSSTSSPCSATIPLVSPVPSPLPTASPTGARVSNTVVTGITITDLRPCLAPTYIPELPTDPTGGSAWNGTNYDTDYYIFQDSSGRLTVYAPSTELASPTISVTR